DEAFTRVYRTNSLCHVALGHSLNTGTPMTTLASQINALTASVREQAPAHVLEAIDAGIRGLAESGLAASALKVGQRAPGFVLPDATGRNVASSSLLARGPVVISFNRGVWCPYCNLEVRAWQQHLPELQALGATLVAISPQLPDSSLT